MAASFFTVVVMLIVGCFSIFSAYRAALSRSKSIESIQNTFKLGVILCTLSIICFFAFFYEMGLADKIGYPLHLKDLKKGEIYVVAKKLDNGGLAKISVFKVKGSERIVTGLPDSFDKDVKFTIKEDGGMVRVYAR